jgi:hypothetical protein
MGTQRPRFSVSYTTNSCKPEAQAAPMFDQVRIAAVARRATTPTSRPGVIARGVLNRKYLLNVNLARSQKTNICTGV